MSISTLHGTRYPTAAAAYAALRAAGGTNYCDPCRHGKQVRGTFVVGARVLTVSKRRGCDALVTDETEYHSYWAGSATAASCRMVAAGTWVTTGPITSKLERDRPAEEAAYARDLAVFDA